MTDRTTRSYAEATHKVATEANAIATQNQTELRSLVESLRGEVEMQRDGKELAMRKHNKLVTQLHTLQREVESLRAALMDPPADVQEAVIKKLGLVSGEGMDLLAQRDTEARRLLALARGVGEYGLGKEWVRDYEKWMGLPKETT